MCGLARGAARGARTPPAPPRPLLEALTRAGPPHRARAQLDYSRCSDLSDSVGYWYVEDRNDGWCRVFYSTDSQIPAWIPGFMKDALVNLAAKRSTAWVDAECRKEMGLQLEGSGGGDVGGGDRSASAPPADTPSPTQQSLLLAALVGAYANHFLARTMALKQARRMVSELIAKVAA